MTSPNEAGMYAPGDVIEVWVTFDRHVVVIGEPILLLNTGKQEPGRATYVNGSGNEVGNVSSLVLYRTLNHPVFYLLTINYDKSPGPGSGIHRKRPVPSSRQWTASTFKLSLFGQLRDECRGRSSPTSTLIA